MLGGLASVIEMVEQAQLLFEEERPKQAAVASETSASAASCDIDWRSGALSSDQRTPFTHLPPSVFDLPRAFHSDREVALTLDDVLIEDGKVAAFRRYETTYTAMGRFGNVMLVNGEPEPSLTARQGEVVRFYLTDTANTRVFNVGLPGARMKLVGGDSGRYEREELVEGVLLAPSERAVVDVLFEEPGQATLEHRTPHRTRPSRRLP